jgi:hypothetical protein
LPEVWTTAYPPLAGIAPETPLDFLRRSVHMPTVARVLPREQAGLRPETND